MSSGVLSVCPSLLFKFSLYSGDKEKIFTPMRFLVYNIYPLLFEFSLYSGDKEKIFAPMRFLGYNIYLHDKGKNLNIDPNHKFLPCILYLERFKVRLKRKFSNNIVIWLFVSKSKLSILSGGWIRFLFCELESEPDTK